MDQERLAEFVRTDYTRIVAALAYVSGDAVRAEDAVQDVLAAALEHDDPIRDLPAWVAKAALNRVRTRVRRSGAERRAYERAARVPPAPTEGEPTLADAALRAALGGLPQRQREVVVLHYLLDMSVSDVAATAGVTAGTVKTQLHRARATLRAHLDERPSPEEVDHVR